jgi:hypothetical protein
VTAVEGCSDHAYDWSARPRAGLGCGFASTSCNPDQTGAASESFAPRLGDRAIQAVREPGLPLCEGPWTWSEALLVGQSSWGATCDGVRSRCLPRAGQRLPGESSTGAGRARGDLRDQPGTSPPQGVAGVASDRSEWARRSCGRGHSGREHDPCAPAEGEVVVVSVGVRASAGDVLAVELDAKRTGQGEGRYRR